jgi:hypothetical protein
MAARQIRQRYSRDSNSDRSSLAFEFRLRRGATLSQARRYGDKATGSGGGVIGQSSWSIIKRPHPNYRQAQGGEQNPRWKCFFLELIDASFAQIKRFFLEPID